MLKVLRIVNIQVRSLFLSTVSAIEVMLRVTKMAGVLRIYFAEGL